MKKSRLFSYVQTFSKEEFQSFKRFLSSPYFNKKMELLNFFEVIEKMCSKNEAGDIDKKEVYTQLFPNKIFDEKHLGYLMSDLCRLIERFWQIEKFEQEKHSKEYYFLESLADRKLTKRYLQHFDKLEKEFENESSLDANFFLQKFLIFDSAVQFNISRHLRAYDKNPEIADQNLDNFYFISKLRYGCSMLNNQNILARNYEINFVEEVKNHIEQDTQKPAPCIEMYFLAAKMFANEEDEAHFQKLLAFIFTKMELISLDDAKYIYAAAINYCARRIREGKREYAENALNLYLHGIETEIFFEDGYLSQQNYKNIINLGLNFRSSEWVEQFILEKNEKLPIAQRDNALHFNLANLYYYRKDYDDAIKHLNLIKFTEISYNFGTKVMLMKIYFELDEDEPLLSLIASFSLYLKRNKKVSRSVKQPYLNFCNILNKIMRRNPKKINAIIEEIKTAPFLNDRNWLLIQATNFKTKIK